MPCRSDPAFCNSGIITCYWPVRSSTECVTLRMAVRIHARPADVATQREKARSNSAQRSRAVYERDSIKSPHAGSRSPGARSTIRIDLAIDAIHQLAPTEPRAVQGWVCRLLRRHGVRFILRAPAIIGGALHPQPRWLSDWLRFGALYLRRALIAG